MIKVNALHGVGKSCELWAVCAVNAEYPETYKFH